MNKVAIVTGSTSGYGLATARKLKENGYAVIIASRNEQKVKDTVEKYGFADGYVIDVTKYAEWEVFANYVEEKYGYADVLVNNAGAGVSIANITEQKIEDIDKSISLNLSSVIYGSSVFGQLMKKNHHGTIVNISSVCAKECWPGWSVYGAAKAGVVNFTKGLYVDLQPYHVRATCIIPASALTGFQKSAGLAENPESLQCEDIANAIWYAVSLPDGAVVEEMTVWGTAQVVIPL